MSKYRDKTITMIPDKVHSVSFRSGFLTARLQALEIAAEADREIAELREALRALMALESRDRVMPVGDEWDLARAALSKGEQP